MTDANRLTEDQITKAAWTVASAIILAARTSGGDPVVWVTGNSFMPPLRSFTAAEKVWQDDPDSWDFLCETVDGILGDAEVGLECPDYDNALYAVDLRRFEYRENRHALTLQDEWVAKSDG